MPWDYTETEYKKQAAADPQWRLERLINYGLGKEKLDRKDHEPRLILPNP